MKKIIIALMIIFCLYLHPNSILAQNELVSVHLPSTCIAGKTCKVKVEIAEPLPASSFYRVSLECQAASSEIKILPGYPESDIEFSSPGIYQCFLESGILTKSSCAGVTYKMLDKKDFEITVIGQ